ncbi:MAG TPA: hypothetical protein VMV29_12595 [Ktedonobacterales bacterium]|nr:hypothetical protein [Ktedonobacterales bacterium]
MSISARAPRPPAAGGGRALLLLGVLLALAAGAIAIFVVSQNNNGGGQMETVVVTTTNVPTGTVLTPTNIGNYFVEKRVTVSSAPNNAYIFTSAAALNSTLNNQVVAQTIYQGDYLFNNDPRLSAGGGAPGSLTNVNRNAIQPGDVIAQLTVSGQVAVVAGDHVDFLVTECNLPGTPGAGNLPCTTQTTLTDVYVYSVNGNTIYLVLTRQKALQLKYLAETGNLELAIRNPQDATTTVTTTAVDAGNIVSSFNY